MKIRDTKDLCELVRGDSAPIFVHAGGTKSVLDVRDASDVSGIELCDISVLTGIAEYEPSEYTMTAAAGTPIAELQSALREHGQYLPFDPLLVEAGATVGGTVASNAAGPGRLRHGGVRDFVLGIRFVDGLGHLGTQGAKVVKNAAGFDFSKLMVGSLGSLGCLTEVTFKVFPKPPNYRTVLVHQLDLRASEALLHSLLRTRTELLAVDLHSVEIGSSGRQWTLAIQIGGPDAGLDERAANLRSWARARTVSDHDVELLADTADAAFWNRTRELNWVDTRRVALKVPMTIPRFVELEKMSVFSEFDRVFSATQQLLVSLPLGETERVDEALMQLGLTGQLMRRGSARKSARVILGQRHGGMLLDRVRQALDPNSRFVQPC